jgi:hypothetical protein
MWKRLAYILDSFYNQKALETKNYAKDLCYKFLIFSHTAFLTLINSTKTNTRTFIFSYYLTKHAKTLKNSGA